MSTLRDITWVIPYYRSLPMLRIHMQILQRYPQAVLDHLRIIYVDDCSPDPEQPDTILRAALAHIRARVRLLRITTDIPWNQHGARNLGASVADTFWLLMTDMDRSMAQDSMAQLMRRKMDWRFHYKPRSLMAVQGSLTRAPRPVNQFMVSKDQYVSIGGYDEDYCGSYGGDGPFLKALAAKYPLRDMDDVSLVRYTNAIIPGSETSTLERKDARAEYGRRFHAKHERGDITPHDPLRFAWMEVSL